MTDTSDDIRNDWITEWRDNAQADDGEWLRDVLDHPDVSTPELVEAQVKLLELIPVEEPEDDWDPNYLFYWQDYGIDPADEALVTVRFHGEQDAALFSEPDSLDRVPFQQIFDALGTQRVIIESNNGEMETLRNAAAFIESALDLSPPMTGVGDPTALPWNGDSSRFEVDLTSAEAERAMTESII